MKDMTSGKTTLISASAAGAAGNGYSDVPSFSSDGTKVIFSSSSSNLVSGDTNGVTDIFIKTIKSGAIKRVSVAPSGLQANDTSNYPVFSADGTKIAYESSASNLVTGDSNSAADVFVAKLK